MALRPVCQYLLFCAGEPRSASGAPGVVSHMLNKKLNLFWHTPPALAQYQVSFNHCKLSPLTHIQLALQDAKIFPFFYFSSFLSFHCKTANFNWHPTGTWALPGAEHCTFLRQTLWGFLDSFLQNVKKFLWMVLLSCSVVTAPPNLVSSTNLGDSAFHFFIWAIDMKSNRSKNLTHHQTPNYLLMGTVF